MYLTPIILKNFHKLFNPSLELSKKFCQFHLLGQRASENFSPQSWAILLPRLLQSCHLEVFLHHHPGDFLYFTFVLKLHFPAFHVCSFFLFYILWWSISPSTFLGSRIFETHNVWKCIYSSLIHYLPKDGIWGWKYFPQNFKNIASFPSYILLVLYCVWFSSLMPSGQLSTRQVTV